MAFTEQQKVDIRRFCGFPVYGNGLSASPPAFGYRYYRQYLILEYRIGQDPNTGIPNMSAEEINTVITVYLNNLYQLEGAIPTASSNLDTDQAAVWYHNKYEVRDRYNLFKLWCKRLIEFLGLESPSPMMHSIAVVV